MSAFNFGGTPRDLLHDAAAREMEVDATETIIAEVIRVLGEKVGPAVIFSGTRHHHRWRFEMSGTIYRSVAFLNPL
jgi:hypothetical protein